MKKQNSLDLIISVDLGWSRNNLSRTAVAWCRNQSAPQWTNAEETRDLIDFLRRFEEEALVLLDIPIKGTEDLGRERPFREMDRDLLSFGIPLLPSFKAGDYGLRLAEEITRELPHFTIVESYPYAVLRFLWAIRDNPACITGELQAVVECDDFIREWPPKYKRARRKADRIVCMSKVLEMLRQFLELDEAKELIPSPVMKKSELNLLCDIYDALLGLIVGRAIAMDSPWFFPATEQQSDAIIPLLLDLNLRNRYEEVRQKRAGG